MELPPVDLGPYFPYLSAESMSEEELSFHRLQLNEETKKIKKSFASLVLNLQKRVEETSKLDDVVNILTFYDNVYEKLLHDCTSIAEVFRKISSVFSFFDYDLVKLLSRKFGSLSIKKDLKKYKKKFQDYSKRRICECPSDAFGDVQKSEKVYVLKTDKSIEDLTVAQLQQLQYEMNKVLGQRLLRLLDVEKGCVSLVFRIFEHRDLSKHQQQALRKLGVLSVTYGEQCVDFSMALASENSLNAKDDVGKQLSGH